jgi:hypothetical protein
MNVSEITKKFMNSILDERHDPEARRLHRLMAICNDFKDYNLGMSEFGVDCADLVSLYRKEIGELINYDSPIEVALFETYEAMIEVMNDGVKGD